MSRVLLVKNNDKRMGYLKQYLESRIEVTEIDDELQLFYALEAKNYDYLILPIRGISDDNLIDGTNIVLSENYLKLFKDKTIFTGLITDSLKQKCEECHIRLITYLNDDIAIKNNYITTEGIIEAISKNSEKAIYNSKILIVGYGKLGIICGNIFKALKAEVTISCRHEKDSLHAQISDFKVINHNQLINNINQFDFIINTVPFRIIDHVIIRKINNPHLLIIDVSSQPYGLDHEYARSLGLKTLLLPGIPGKIAPITAGELIGQFIINILMEGSHSGRW